jgi:hypothetical protein
MEGFLRSPEGTFLLFVVSAGPFLLAGIGSDLCPPDYPWPPRFRK